MWQTGVVAVADLQMTNIAHIQKFKNVWPHIKKQMHIHIKKQMQIYFGMPDATKYRQLSTQLMLHGVTTTDTHFFLNCDWPNFRLNKFYD